MIDTMDTAYTNGFWDAYHGFEPVPYLNPDLDRKYHEGYAEGLRSLATDTEVDTCPR